MDDVPDRIYIHPGSTLMASIRDLAASPGWRRIEYRRVKPCVWQWVQMWEY